MFPGRGRCSENSRARHRWSQSMRASALSSPSTGLTSLNPFKTEGIALGGIEENSNAGSPQQMTKDLRIEMIAASEKVRFLGFHSLGLHFPFAMSKANSMKFFSTVTLSILINPFLFVQALLLNIGQLCVGLRNMNELNRSGRSVTSQRYGLPLCGEWLVANGGVTKQTSHSWDLPNQRYAYDFVKAAESLEGRSHLERRSLTDFSAFGQPIFAPADGIVVRARDGQRDYRFPGSGEVDMWCRDIRGNHILIQHRQDEFSLLTHLRKGSVSVAAGDSVRVGQKIGECGNSGHSTEPHLHFHVQDRPSFYAAASKIVLWSRLCRNGTVIDDCADLTCNDCVSDASGQIM